MKTILCLILTLVGMEVGRCGDGRVITENGTNILAIGIDQRDFDVIRFYLRGTNILEFRADQIIHRDRPIVPATLAPIRSAERAAIVDALQNQTNFGAGQVQIAVSNLVRLRMIDELARPSP